MRNKSVSYIYIRTNDAYDEFGACKISYTTNLSKRIMEYSTREYKLGRFVAVFSIPNYKLNIVRNLLQNRFRHLHIYHDNGNEFYDKKIIPLIKPFIESTRIKYSKIPDKYISKLVNISLHLTTQKTTYV